MIQGIGMRLIGLQTGLMTIILFLNIKKTKEMRIDFHDNKLPLVGPTSHHLKKPRK